MKFTLPIGLMLASSLFYSGTHAGRTEPDSPSSTEQTSELSAKNIGIVLTITGVSEAEGRVIVLVFDDADAYKNYDHERAVAITEINAAPGTLTHSFPNLSKGPYAIIVFHDENGDYELNMDFDIPLEGFAFSGSKGPYDEPSFQQAAIVQGEASVKINYLH